jgi:hypothetical protein
MPRILGLFLLLVAAMEVFISTYGDLGIPYFLATRTVLLYVTCVLLIVFYVVIWLEAADSFKVGVLRSLSALSLGLFLTAFLIETLDHLLNFLDLTTRGILQNHLYSRTLLLAVSAVHLLVYAAAKSIQNAIKVPSHAIILNERYFLPLSASKGSDLLDQALDFIRPFVNVILSFMKALIANAITIINFIVRVTLVVAYRIKDYCVELLQATTGMLRVLWSALRDFAREFILPLLLFYLLHSELAVFAQWIVDHIHNNPTEISTISVVITFLAINLILMLLPWLLTYYRFVESATSIALSNVSVSLLLVLYSAIASLELWLLSQWWGELPYGSLGAFTLGTVLIIVVITVVLFAARIVREQI